MAHSYKNMLSHRMHDDSYCKYPSVNQESKNPGFVGSRAEDQQILLQVCKISTRRGTRAHGLRSLLSKAEEHKTSEFKSSNDNVI